METNLKKLELVNSINKKNKSSNSKFHYILLWMIGAGIYLILSVEFLNSVVGLATAFGVCLCIILLLNLFNKRYLSYALFFSITLTSLLGITKTLTGSHATSTQPFLMGLSFYTATLAYYIATKKPLNFFDVFKISNPLLLVTGPIVLFVKDYRYRDFKKRFNYYFPFVIVGFFLYQVIAAPLTYLFKLIELTDLVSSLTFAFVFELFVYANFCGLSLIIYGVFGIIGYKIPLNFRQPFSSTNVIDFWKGWHVSLSAVLKELFYVPIRKKFPSSVALLSVFIASAMWHGVTFNFLLWGLFHALIFIVTIYLLKLKVKYLPAIVLVLAVVIGRLLFADSQTNRLLEKLAFNYDGFSHLLKVISVAPKVSLLAFIMGFGLILIEFLFQNYKIVKKRNYKYLRTPISLLILTIIGIFLASDVGGNFAVYGQR